MFEPEVFGLKASDYLQFASGLLTPALGFLFLYLLALPLKKIPFIDVDVAYKPPSWVVPLFAIGSVFALSLTLSLSGFLNYFRAHPSAQISKASFLKERAVSVPPDAGKLLHAKMILIDYDGSSNFRINVNGYRVLGSHSDCRFSYQCKRPAPSDVSAFKDIQNARLIDRSILHIHRMYSLPFEGDLTGYLVAGVNFVDVFSENSGLGDCRLETKFLFAFQTKTITHWIEVSGASGKPTIVTEGSQTKHVLHAGGIENSQESDTIAPYNTKVSNASYRTCERLRLVVDLGPAGVEQTETQWRSWMSVRRKDAICEVAASQRRYCETADAAK